MRCIRWGSSMTKMNKADAAKGANRANGANMVVYVTDTRALLDDAVFQAAYHAVSLKRREKTDRFVFRKDKMLSLAAGLLLQKGLRDRGIVEYSIACGANGKPYLEGCCYGADGDPSPASREFAGMEKARPPVFFNLSHAEEKVMCVISDLEVGCDVERVTDIDLEIAKRFFFTTEYETIAGGKTPEQQRELFYRFWTMKESFMKVTGLGMSLPLDAFRVELSREGMSRKELSGNGEEQLGEASAAVFHMVNDQAYRLKEYDPGNGYRYAVCSPAGGAPFPSAMISVGIQQILMELEWQAP